VADYRIVAIPNDTAAGDSTVLADLEIHFTGGDLAGMKLVGFNVRRSQHGGTYVTFPARAFGQGQDRQYFDYVRPLSGDHDTARGQKLRAKQNIKDAWKATLHGEEAPE